MLNQEKWGKSYKCRKRGGGLACAVLFLSCMTNSHTLFSADENSIQLSTTKSQASLKRRTTLCLEAINSGCEKGGEDGENNFY